MGATQDEMTRQIAEFISQADPSGIPEPIYEHAKVAVMDWLGVTLAGCNEPLVNILLEQADAMGGSAQASIIGRGQKRSVAQAALINGAASHALDFDDTLYTYISHPTATLLPGLFALAQWRQKDGKSLLAAYIIGFEVGVVIGVSAGLAHYMSGYHATSTIGSLASAAAAAFLLELDTQHSLYALGIGGTQSAGLKQVFGTMCKPFHAGRASEIGVTAALLAQAGFTSAEDILEGANGFFSALGGKADHDALSGLGSHWEIVNLAQKYHASCHGTHSALEASQRIFRENRLSMSDVQSIRVTTSEVALAAAFRTTANTGLEGKFSIAYCVTNAVMRNDTGLKAFTDGMVRSPVIQENMKKVRVQTDPGFTGMAARVEVETDGGQVFESYSDVFDEIPDLEEKKGRIQSKFAYLAEPHLDANRIGKITDAISNLESIDNIAGFIEELSC